MFGLRADVRFRYAINFELIDSDAFGATPAESNVWAELPQCADSGLS